MKMYSESVVLNMNGKVEEFPCRNLYNVAEFVGMAHNAAYRHFGKNWRNYASIIHVDKWGRENYIYDPIDFAKTCFAEYFNKKKA